MADAMGMAAHAAPGLDTAGLLALVQYGDSAFPSGATAFSWGLESLLADGLVPGAPQLLEVLCALVEQRWAGFDRPLLRAAYEAAPPGDGWQALIAIDQLCEAMTLNQGARAASTRLGFTQLRVHAELGLHAAADYLEEVRAGRAPGHLPIAQGLVWQGLALPLPQAEAMAALGQCIAVTGAAIRLGRLGHVQAQRLLAQARPRIAAVLAQAPPALDDIWNGAPALEIAAMRHETRSARLFAN
jgi:urease accessory protein